MMSTSRRPKHLPHLERMFMRLLTGSLVRSDDEASHLRAENLELVECQGGKHIVTAAKLDREA